MSRLLGTGRHWLLSPQLVLGSRMVLGGLYVAAGWSKIGHQGDLMQTVIGFGILPDFLVRPFSLALPWVEFLSGSLLILGILVPSANGLLALTTSAFLFAIGVNLWRGTEIDCGCFGQKEPLSWEIFVRDVGLLVLSIQILVARRGNLSLPGGLAALSRFRQRRRHSL